MQHEKWGQVDLPQHPTPRQSKRCAKAAPNGMDNAVNVRSRVELSAQADCNVFLHIAKSPLIRRFAPPSPRTAGRRETSWKTDWGQCSFLALLEMSALTRKRCSCRSPRAINTSVKHVSWTRRVAVSAANPTIAEAPHTRSKCSHRRNKPPLCPNPCWD